MLLHHSPPVVTQLSLPLSDKRLLSGALVFSRDYSLAFPGLSLVSVQNSLYGSAKRIFLKKNLTTFTSLWKIPQEVSPACRRDSRFDTWETPLTGAMCQACLLCTPGPLQPCHISLNTAPTAQLHTPRHVFSLLESFFTGHAWLILLIIWDPSEK